MSSSPVTPVTHTVTPTVAPVTSVATPPAEPEPEIDDSVYESIIAEEIAALSNDLQVFKIENNQEQIKVGFIVFTVSIWKFWLTR